MLWIIQKEIDNKMANILMPLYKLIGRLHLEFNVQFWSLLLKNDMEMGKGTEEHDQNNFWAYKVKLIGELWLPRKLLKSVKGPLEVQGCRGAVNFRCQPQGSANGVSMLLACLFFIGQHKNPFLETL